MKQIITLIAVLSFWIVNGQTTLIPDPFFEQWLITHGHDTGTPDGSVPTANIDTLVALSISTDTNITDLTGIEAMIALVEFYVGWCPLITSIDFSSNIALKKITCPVNLSLSSINVSNNPLLEDLFLGINNLNSLDVTNNPLLKTLYCGNNPIPSLDVSQNLNLVYLSCSTTMITSLDVSNNPLLTTLYSFGCPQLQCLNMKNGNNSNFNIMTAYNTPNLNCIEVDNSAWAANMWTSPNYIDPTCSFNTNCNYSTSCFAITGIQEHSSILNLYPNPFSTSTTIELPSEPHILTIYDIVGNKVREEQVSGTTTIERGDLTKGVYVLEVRSESQSYSGKLVVE